MWCVFKLFLQIFFSSVQYEPIIFIFYFFLSKQESPTLFFYNSTFFIVQQSKLYTSSQYSMFHFPINYMFSH